MNFEILFVLLALIGMIAALIWDKMRPGMILFSVTVLFLCAGILTPKELLEGFSNKGMITVALLFLVSEGVRQSGALTQIIRKVLPQSKTTVFKAQLRMLPSIAFISAFLNNTPVVVIFAPIIKRWAKSIGLPATKFLIPLSYVTILGGICTLIGTSTNLVVHGMMIDAGYEGLSMFELGMIKTSRDLADKYHMPLPLLFSVVLGHIGASPATSRTLRALVGGIEEFFGKQEALWGITHAHRRDFEIVEEAVELGASTVRIGFEDSNYLAPGMQVDENLPLVERVREILNQHGAEAATAEEGRRMLRIGE